MDVIRTALGLPPSWAQTLKEELLATQDISCPVSSFPTQVAACMGNFCARIFDVATQQWDNLTKATATFRLSPPLGWILVLAAVLQWISCVFYLASMLKVSRAEHSRPENESTTKDDASSPGSDPRLLAASSEITSPVDTSDIPSVENDSRQDVTTDEDPLANDQDTAVGSESLPSATEENILEWHVENSMEKLPRVTQELDPKTIS
ncbi:MAG: hypothetical protein Q9168_005570 [Polycauliona sp. 1 TL-2023]